MKGLLQSIRVCRYQLHILSRNYKICVIPICLFVFLWNTIEPLREFMMAADEQATPFLFSCLFSSKLLTALVFAGVFLFFTDAPFYGKQQLFVVMRCEIVHWIGGQVIYVAVVSVLYMLATAVMSVLILFPYIRLENAWGRVWSTLAYTDAAYLSMIPVSPNGAVLADYTPIQATVLTFLLGILICMFYGFCLWCLNLYVGKYVSLAVVLASDCLVVRVAYFPPWVSYLVQSSWADLGNLSYFTSHRISVGKAFLMLGLGTVVLAVLAVWKTLKSDLAK